MQNNFSISNTDLVTMLMVKQKELLNNRLTELRALTDAYKTQAYNKAKKKFNSKFKEIQPLLDKYEELIKLFNPKVKFEIRVHAFTKDCIRLSSESVQGEYYYCAHYDFIYFEIDIDEKHEDKYISIEPDNGFFVPFKFLFKEKLDAKFLAITNEIYDIESILRNNTKLRDRIVAKMTETALQNMPELKMLSENALVDLKLLS